MHQPQQKFANFALSSRIQASAAQPTKEEDVTDSPETNKRVVRDFVAAWNDRDFAAFDHLMGDGAVLTVGGQKVPCDPAGTRAIAEEWTTAFPDWRFDLLALVAEGDLVAAHMPYEGTFERPLYGAPPTGRFARVDEMVFFRIAGGKVVEAWEVYDDAGMWRQLGTHSGAE
jgi:predicted ester cyclase